MGTKLGHRTAQLSFFVKGTIADVDSTTTLDSIHPALVLVVDVGPVLQQIAIPSPLLAGDLSRFRVGTPIRISGVRVETGASGAIALVAQEILLGH